MAGAKGAAAVLANAQTCAVIGLDGYVVQVEVDISPGLPEFKNEGQPGQPEPQLTPNGLNQREVEVLRLIRGGKTD